MSIQMKELTNSNTLNGLPVRTRITILLKARLCRQASNFIDDTISAQIPTKATIFAIQTMLKTKVLTMLHCNSDTVHMRLTNAGRSVNLVGSQHNGNRSYITAQNI